MNSHHFISWKNTGSFFKASLFFIFLTLLNLYSQDFKNVGINVGGVFPLGEVHKTHQYGVKFGLSEVFLIKPPFFSIAANQEYSVIVATGKSLYYPRKSFGKDDIEYFSFSIGPRFGNRYGPILMSGIIYSLYSAANWTGVDAGLGYAFKSSGLAHTIDMVLKIRWVNNIKKDEYDSILVVSELSFIFYF